MPYHSIAAGDVEAFIDQQQPVVFDMRDPASQSRGTIAGAQPVTDAVIGSLRRAGDLDRPLLIYCYHGISSRDLATFLASLGFRNVYNLEGGWAAWEAQQAAPFQPSPKLIEWYVANGFSQTSPLARGPRGMTPLMLACLHGTRAVIDELLEIDTDLDAINDDGNTALWFACANGRSDLIRLLIRHGVDIDHRNHEGATCLIYTASAGKSDVVLTLLDAGADLAPETVDGFTALDCAANLQTLRLLQNQNRRRVSADC